MTKTLCELAGIVQGTLVGDGSVVLRGAARAEDIQVGEITFAVSQKFLAIVEDSPAAAVIIPRELTSAVKPAIQVDNARLAFAKVLEVFAGSPEYEEGIHPSAVIAPDADIEPGVGVGAGSVVEAGARIARGSHVGALSYVGPGVSIGEGTVLHPRVCILRGTCIGRRVILHSGCVIGSDGFGFVKMQDGSYYKIPQLGKVVIEDDVEIGANVTIDRATTGETRIGRGTKIDNLVHIAHNVTVGQNVAIVALVGVSGSCNIGSGVTLAGQVGIVDHVSIGDNVVVGAKSGVSKSIPRDTYVWGIPARNHAEQKRITAVMHRLPELAKRVQKLEKRLGEGNHGMATHD
jgi:UDP-3-O-[3-hydroxymyristoyl] glucosamine N-acyltransferase